MLILSSWTLINLKRCTNTPDTRLELCLSMRARTALPGSQYPCALRDMVTSSTFQTNNPGPLDQSCQYDHTWTSTLLGLSDLITKTMIDRFPVRSYLAIWHSIQRSEGLSNSITKAIINHPFRIRLSIHSLMRPTGHGENELSKKKKIGHLPFQSNTTDKHLGWIYNARTWPGESSPQIATSEEAWSSVKLLIRSPTNMPDSRQRLFWCVCVLDIITMYLLFFLFLSKLRKKNP